MNEIVITVHNVKELSVYDLNNHIRQLLFGFIYKEENYCGDLNHIHTVLNSKDSAFKCKFAYFLYRLIGHHDHMEIEAITCGARVRAEALLLSLQETISKKPLT
jgi:hypothetical protein